MTEEKTVDFDYIRGTLRMCVGGFCGSGEGVETVEQFEYHRAIEWPRPIPVSERLPNATVECLFWHVDDWFRNSWDDVPEQTRAEITHWLPLPPAPKATP